MRAKKKPMSDEQTSLRTYHQAVEHWHAANPGATQAQIDAAMRRIALECGV